MNESTEKTPEEAPQEHAGCCPVCAATIAHTAQELGRVMAEARSALASLAPLGSGILGMRRRP